jgi:protein TIF31
VHHLTNYHLEYEGKPLNEYLELSHNQDLPLDATLSIVHDNYNERTARAHFLRLKELISAAGSSGKGLGEDWGIAAGCTLAERVSSATPPTPGDLGNYFSQPLENLSSVLAPGLTFSQQPSSTVKSLILSQWNPPPPHRRTQGDLLYIQFTSLEGDLYHITGHIKGFYVSRSTNQKFDPTPKSPQKLPTQSLLTLLQSLSPQFSNTFATLHSTDANTEILSDAPLGNALPAFPWLVQPTLPFADPIRTQKPWLESLAEGQGNLRDWNDEIQSTRSLPSTGVRERLIRERLLQKSLADFAACATYAAMLVRRGELLPLDPIPENHDGHAAGHGETIGTMWHYNNVFLSLGADDVVGSFEEEGGGEASRVAVGKDVIGVQKVNSLLLEAQSEGDKDTGLCTLGTVIVDYLGERLVAQSVVPGIFQQAPETSKEEEGASAGAHRIVYGAVDNAEKIYADTEFDEKFAKLMDKLHIKRHDVWEVPKKPKNETDGVNGEEILRQKRTICTSLETKGLRGADGRKYVLDLYKLTPLDVVFIEETFTKAEDAYPHRMVFLRRECVDAFWESKLRAWISDKLAERKRSKSESEATEEGEAEKETEKIDISEFEFALNPDVFTPSQAPVSEEEEKRLSEDETDVRACCAFLRENLIPNLIKELTDGTGGWPVDGKSLTVTMHRNGVNVRYIGKVIELCGEAPKLQAVKVCILQDFAKIRVLRFMRWCLELPSMSFLVICENYPFSMSRTAFLTF